MEVAEVGAAGGTKMIRSLVHKAKQFFNLCHWFALHILL